MSSGGQTFDLIRERERLLMRCEAQRLDIAASIATWQGPLKIADRVLEGVNYLRSHPVVFGAAFALLIVIRPRGWLGWLRRGFMIWRAYRAFSNTAAP